MLSFICGFAVGLIAGLVTFCACSFVSDRSRPDNCPCVDDPYAYLRLADQASRDPFVRAQEIASQFRLQ